MHWIRAALSRLSALFHARSLDATLDEEMREHIALATEEHMRRGMPESEARRRTLAEFGGVTQARESYRVRRGVPGLERLGRDLRYGVMQLRKSPGFTLTAIATLALGVGANTTVFSMIDSLLLRPLNVPQSDRLAVLGIFLGGPGVSHSFSEPLFRGLEHSEGVFQSVFAFDHAPFQVKSGGATEIVYGQYVSGNFFDTLQVAPLLGRTLNARDDRAGGDPAGFAAVIGESLWANRFHRDPAALGQKIVIDNVAFTIVGVMPRSFVGADPLQRPQIFVSLADEETLNGANSMVKAGIHGWWLSVMGRLAPGRTIKEANAQVAASSLAILESRANDSAWVAHQLKRGFRFAAEPGSTGFTYLRLNFRKPLISIFAMCGGVLLLACLNLASLLMARGSARQRELATRMAIGASRRLLVQQLLVEGLLLGIAGTAVGLLSAPLVSRLLAAVLLSGQQGVTLDTSPDWRVFAFAAGVALLATLLFALAPALKATQSSLIDKIKDGQHSTRANERRSLLPRLLLGAEVGVALVLVVGAGLIATSLLRLYASGTGFDPHNVVNISFQMEKAGLKGESVFTFCRTMAERISHLPGVTQVSYARMVPLTGMEWDTDIKDAAGGNHDIFLNQVAPGYFAAMGIPQHVGRDFTWNDTPASGPKIILNEKAAKALFPNRNALGQTITLRDIAVEKTLLVIGLVADSKYSQLRDDPPPIAYVALSQDDGQRPVDITAVVRTSRPAGLAEAVRTYTAQLAPLTPPPEARSLMATLDDSLSAERMMTLLAVFFAVCALAVTAVGLYGTLAYATARRTTEIGIRMALGAQRAQVAAMVFVQNLRVVMGGALVGLAIALLATRALAGFLFETSTHDPWVIALALLALALTACAASLLPALRAARIGPMMAIRND